MKEKNPTFSANGSSNGSSNGVPVPNGWFGGYEQNIE
jgi:hypothetical protein